jgi:multiple sugar transport system substrate-binding protein
MKDMYFQPKHAAISRRSLLLAGLGTAMSAPFLASCAGFDTSGASAGEGTVGFLSTQFTPVEEKQRYEAVLKKFAKAPVAYNSVDPGVFSSTVSTQASAGNVKTSLLGGLHGELAPLAESLEDVDNLLRDLSGRGFTKEMLELTKVGGSTSRYVPWMQATYVVAVNKKALEWLPSGVDVNDLTYEGYLAWAKAAKQGAGRPVFGMPAGPQRSASPFLPGLPVAELHWWPDHHIPERGRRHSLDLHAGTVVRPDTCIHQLRLHAGATGAWRSTGGVGPRGAAGQRTGQ